LTRCGLFDELPALGLNDPLSIFPTYWRTKLFTMPEEEMMSVRQSLLVALVSVAGFGSSPMASAHAATFTCPDTMAADSLGAASSLSELYAGANDITARNRLGELMTDLRKSGMKPALIVDHLIGHIARSSQPTPSSQTSRRPTGFGGSRDW
jgi:hypothetical protein